MRLYHATADRRYLDLARYFVTFTQNESCGKCVPCREGTRQMLALLDDIATVLDDVAVMTKVAADYGLSAPVAILCGIAVTTLFGLINGLLVTRVKLPPFIVTLGMLEMARGAAHGTEATHCGPRTSSAALAPLPSLVWSENSFVPP